jgi:hypothetical protein
MNAILAQLKADINAGLTGEKVPGFDPATAPLGTDEEAAGTPTSDAAARDARTAEPCRPRAHGWVSGRALPSSLWASSGR